MAVSTLPRCLALCAALVAIAPVSAAADRQAGDLGPFRLGMTFAAARAAAPRALWSETLSRYTQAPVELTGRGALKLEGVPFDVTLKPLAYDGYRMDISHAEVAALASEGRCASAVAIVVRALEGRFGPLGPMSPLSRAETDGLPDGFDILVGLGAAETMALGRASSVPVFRPRGRGTTLWLAGRRRDGMTVVLGGRFFDRTRPFEPSTCVVTARLTALPPRPAFEWVDLARFPRPPAPSIPSRRRSFSRLAELPTAPGAVEISCDVDRRSGQVSKCATGAGVAEALARPAIRQGESLRLEPTALDPDSDVPLRLRLTLPIDPADAKVVALPAGVTPLKLTEVAWSRQPSGEDIARRYPDRALRLGVGALVTVLCRIEADGVLTCLDETVRAGEGQEEMFEGWGVNAAALYRAAPTLPDGRASAGQWVTLSFALKSN